MDEKWEIMYTWDMFAFLCNSKVEHLGFKGFKDIILDPYWIA